MRRATDTLQHMALALGATRVVTSQACFNPNTGFLERTRALLGSSPGDRGVLSIFLNETTDNDGLGHVSRDLVYGGDADRPNSTPTTASVT